jgi:hypothetical protein
MKKILLRWKRGTEYLQYSLAYKGIIIIEYLLFLYPSNICSCFQTLKKCHDVSYKNNKKLSQEKIKEKNP